MNKEGYTVQKDGVEMIKYAPGLMKSVRDTAESWKKFCDLSVEYKQLFVTHDSQSGVGYESKDGGGSHGDRKENFDYADTGDDFDEILRENPNEAAQRFIQFIRQLNTDIQPMIEEFGKKANIPVNGATAFFRCLHYPSGARKGQIIAEPHTDHSGFTFHLYETTSGCERLDFAGKWLPLPVAKDEAAAFGGMQSQLMTNGNIKAMCHRVVANEISAKAGRIAIVCFVSLSDAPRYNKEKYGRLQEMKPGFNYQMSQEEFRKLFTR
jgi:isopenicillin N synthase-like dioxygenase